MATLSTIPVIDISPFIHGASDSTDSKRQVAAQVGDACEDIGFFVIAGHDVPDDLLRRTYEMARGFFDLPLEEKLKVRVNSSGTGYVPMNAESLAASLGRKTPGDLKESLNIGRDFDHDLWPAYPPDLKPTWMEYFKALNQLATTLMRVVALALDLPEGYFDDKIDSPQAFLRAINYPDQNEDPLPGQLRAGEHSDYGTLTILLSENAPGGLQVRTRANEWVDVVSPPKSFVINIGDMMQYWTNDRWTSTAHRVVNPPRDRRMGSRRQSLVFFHNPNEDTLISCLPTCQSVGNPPKYPPILAGEHLRQKSEKAGSRTKDSGCRP